MTDLATIRALCEKYDFALSKGFGQNFIINPGVCPKIVDGSGIDRSWGVIEIGPGIGVLTKELARRAGKVVAIEVDKRLPPVLAETLAEFDNVKILLQDVLTLDLHQLIREEFPDMPVAVCANLPYYITSPIIMKLLEDRLPIRSVTVMVQKEAADRLAAAPGTRESGAISCAVQYFAEPKMLFTVQPGSFYPAPKVTSAVVRLDIRPAPAVQVPDEKGYFALVRAAFGQRRKTAANSIASGLGLPKEAVLAALERAGLDPRVRPEKLTLADFAALQAALGTAR
ncbi:MAG: 16S rRNA (adenine(1518)-N(6)/adenine(1519)-N(6))-dimethyltransferase RsmA [Candidatus Faecalibacterium intestinavium]|uniref:Ribosomal RNA small subunit methyltransferase A n=1 Tax=Candidatus Faecalibacterium intestinavium TaxID=2838580 RepID=A0A9E2KKR5_9FIRM|nr:16S rRNA (adenine(1518)-N(6)/adenine(1519)-N(6))-dimethyltransferase RsmA [Candidatus Faecalibacterium intestinavium]